MIMYGKLMQTHLGLLHDSFLGRTDSLSQDRRTFEPTSFQLGIKHEVGHGISDRTEHHKNH